MWVSISIHSCYQHERKNRHSSELRFLAFVGGFPSVSFLSFPLPHSLTPLPPSASPHTAQGLGGALGCTLSFRMCLQPRSHLPIPLLSPALSCRGSFLSAFLFLAPGSRIPVPTLWCDLKQGAQTLSAFILLDSPISSRY